MVSETIAINSNTKEVIDFLTYGPVFQYRERKPFHPRDQKRGAFVNLELLRAELVRLEGRIVTNESIGNPPFTGEDISDWLWLLYEDDADIIPIYSDGVAVTRWKPIVQPSAIPNILSFLVVNKSVGIDIENHGFGYHFHYGEIKKDRLVRSNLLLTFDPRVKVTDASGTSPLYAENHGGGWRKDVSTLGNSKRGPIYNVCESEMRKRGLENFRNPSVEASVFYPV